MNELANIREQVINALQSVIDPETGANVVRMRLVLDLAIDEDGTATYTFRPSSPLCPIALTLILNIIETIKNVEGVTNQNITVVDYIGSDALNALLSNLPLSKKDV